MGDVYSIKNVIQEGSMKNPLTSRIERNYYLISTSYLAGLFDIFILLHIRQNYVCFGDLLPMRTLFVMLIIRNLNLISVQSWTYLEKPLG